MEEMLVADNDVLAKLIMAPEDSDKYAKNGGHLLTRKEVYLLSLVAAGFEDQEIADDTCMSFDEVEASFSVILKKIKVSNRLQAVLWATKNV